MRENIIGAELLFSFAAKSYRICGNTTKYVPALAVVSTKSSAMRGSEHKTGFYLYPVGGSTGVHFWELRHPIDDPQTYLGLRLLAECPSICDDTLCACFYAMSEHIDETTSHYLKSLESSGFSNVKERRLQLLAEKDSNPRPFRDYLETLEERGAFAEEGPEQNENAV